MWLSLQLELADVHRRRGEQAGVGDDAALRRPGRAGRVDDRRHVVAARRARAALGDDGLARLRAAGAQLGQRARRPGVALEHDHVLELRAALADLLDLGDLRGVLAEDGADARRGRGCTRTPRASWSGRSGRRSPRRSARRSRRASTPGGCPARIATWSPRSIPSSARPPAISRIARAELGVGDRLPPGGGEGVALPPARGGGRAMPATVPGPMWAMVVMAGLRRRWS